MNDIWQRGTLALIISGICASYLGVSIAQPIGLSDLSYPVLAAQFLRGHVSLPSEPDPRLLASPDPYAPEAQRYGLHDASLYHGKYYLYFGVVPAVMLFAPYRLATGHDLPQGVAVPLFCIGGYLSSCSLFFLLFRRNRWPLPFWMQCIAVTLLGTASMAYEVCPNARIYQVSCAAGFCFVASGFLALAQAYYRKVARSEFLFLAGLLFGLAVGRRAELILVCLVVLGAQAMGSRNTLASVLPLAISMILVGIGLSFYNYIRFDNPLEFGRNYQLAGFDDASVRRNVKTSIMCAGSFYFCLRL